MRNPLRSRFQFLEPGAIEDAAKAVILSAYGKAIPRKHAGRRPLRDMSARTMMRMSVSRLERIIRTDNAAQVISEALEQAPKVKLALVKALDLPPSEPTTTEKPDILSAFERFEAAFQPLCEAVGNQPDTPRLTEIAGLFGGLFDAFREELVNSQNSQVVDSIEPEAA